MAGLLPGALGFWGIPYYDLAPEVKITKDDIGVGSYWKSVDDGSVWRVVQVDNYIHVSNNRRVDRWGLNLFVTSFKRVEYGADCVGCGEKFEYAEKVSSFKCWKCKNGA